MRLLLVSLVVGAALLAACGRDQAAGSNAGPTREPDDAASPSRPWEVRSEPGLWRVSTGGAESRLICHAGGRLLPDEGAGCDRPSQRLGDGGWVRERRCSGERVRTVVVGDLASGFSAATRRGDAEAAGAWLRLGPCPDGWRAGETRAEGLRPPPVSDGPTPRPAAPRPRPAAPAPITSDPVEAPPLSAPELEPSDESAFDPPPAEEPAPSDKPL